MTQNDRTKKGQALLKRLIDATGLNLTLSNSGFQRVLRLGSGKIHRDLVWGSFDKVEAWARAFLVGWQIRCDCVSDEDVDDTPMTRWQCPKCSHRHRVPAYELATIGTPHCPDCEEVEMEPCPNDTVCQRCGCNLSAGGYCTDETCPFCQHKQTCAMGWKNHPNRNPKLKCTCGSQGDYGTAEDCPKSPAGKHEPDARDITAADADMTVDLVCKHCGRSGAAFIETAEIDW